MRRIAFVLVVCLLAGSVATWSARAEDPASPEARIAALESRLARLEAQLVELQEKLDALLAGKPRVVAPKPLTWIPVRDEEHLRAALAAAAKEGRPVVVNVFADWCSYCKAYRKVIDEQAAVRAGFERLVRLSIDVTLDPRDALRKAIRVGRGQPKMVFFDAKGNPVGSAKITRWHGEKNAQILEASLEKTTR